MVDNLIWGFIFIYLVIGFFLTKRLKGRTAKAIAVIVFLLPMTPLLYKHIFFRINCYRVVEEQVFDPRSSVNGLLISYNWGMDTRWVSWLVDSGGYQFAEYKTGNEFERKYWNNEFRMLRRMSSPTTSAKYEIKILQSSIGSEIVKNELIAIDRETNRILGRKVVLFLQAGWISRYLNWKLTNDMDRGGISCPRIGSIGDLLQFFPSKVLIPEKR